MHDSTLSHSFIIINFYSKHGCDYKGYGLASRLPRLDLSAFVNESLTDRQRPVVQQFCIVCQSPGLLPENELIPCQGGCSRAYHRRCHSGIIDPEALWYCKPQCKQNKEQKQVVVDLPRKYMPLMRPHKIRHL
ncbi:hypothetical protein BD560DRAFT_186874 [Blakeslea trispora]|nr:hypothetical protein BD560DRAFT_186874 [Blakeslea trispora]